MSPNPDSDTPYASPLLARLQSMPRLTVPVAVLVLMLIGLMAPPAIGVPALAVLIVFIGWLATLAWPSADPGGRVLRVAILIVLGALLLGRTYALLA